jgi:hypothetical protein
MRMLGVSTLFFAAAAFAGFGCSSDDGDTADAGTGSDASVEIPDGAPVIDAALPDASADLPDAEPLPDAAIAQCGRIRCDCTFNGIQLWGRVQYVTSFPDIQVRESAFPDLRVREGSFPDSCGEWQIVDAFPDFTVEIVTSFEDFEIGRPPAHTPGSWCGPAARPA